MFNQIFKQPTRISRHLNAPLLEDRLRYLIYRSKQETAKSVLCQIAHFQLILIKHLHLEKNKLFTPEKIKTSAKRWANHKTQGCINDDSIVQRRCENFIRYANLWLRFLGRIQISKKSVVTQITEFAEYMRNEKCLSEVTIFNHCFQLEKFLSSLTSLVSSGMTISRTI